MLIEQGTTDEKIVEATFNLLKEEGIEKTTTKKIATAAGVNEVTIFRNFKNKKNLIEITKDYYLTRFTELLDEIFDFEKDEPIEDYLKKLFLEILNLPDEEFTIVRIALAEVEDIPEKKSLILEIINVMLFKLESFFDIKIEKDEIRNDLNSKVLAINCFSVVFQSVVLWKLYYSDTNVGDELSNNDFLDILFNGIKK